MVIAHEDQVHLTQIIIERPAKEPGEVKHAVAALRHVGDDFVKEWRARHELEQGHFQDEDLGGLEQPLAAVQGLEFVALNIHFNQLWRVG